MLLLSLLSACQQDDNEPAPGERPDERLTKVLTDYKAQLVGATYGWKTIIKPEGGGSYSFLMKFNENDRVSMFSDINSASAGPGVESTYRLKAMQRPTLLFDTYSPLHILSDPDPNVAGGIQGRGLISDFEYTIDSISANTVQLTGNLEQTKVVLVKATKEEFDAYQAGGLKTVIDESNAYTQANPFLYLQATDGTKIQVNINAITKTFSFVYLQNGRPQILSTTFTYTPTGLLLDPPINLGGASISELLWDSTNKVFYVIINGTRLDVLSSPTYIIPLHYFVGVSFNAISVPPQEIPGWSPDFTNKWKQAANAILNGPYQLSLYYIDFTFDTGSQTMNVYTYVIQNNNLYLATFPYRYSKTAEGVYKFTAMSPTGNAQLIAQDMKPILDHIATDNFTLDYFQDAQLGTLGQIKSVQSPEFFFTGFLEE